jgi:hypothetical protein
MKVLPEDGEYPADEEEKEIFKEARKLGDDRLEQLGQQIEERKRNFNPRGPANKNARAERRKSLSRSSNRQILES